jgi:hypothetical protein
MAEVVRTLRFVSVRDGMEVDALMLFDDGTIITRVPHWDGTARGVLRTIMRVEEMTEREAFDDLARSGWSNGYTMIHLANIDEPPPVKSWPSWSH